MNAVCSEGGSNYFFRISELRQRAKGIGIEYVEEHSSSQGLPTPHPAKENKQTNKHIALKK